jgi:hypothetical protein
VEPTTLGPVATALVWAQWYLAPILALSVSAAYLTTSPKTQPLSERLLASSAGMFIAAIYCLAGTIALLGLSRPGLATLFAVALLLAIGLIGLSFRLYRGRKRVHLLQFINVACLAWTGFVGGMATTGRWL